MFYLFACWVIFHAFSCRLLIFFFKIDFRKIISGIPSECQRVWIQIRPDKTSGLIWVQTVSKSYQQTTVVGKELIIITIPNTKNLSLSPNFKQILKTYLYLGTDLYLKPKVTLQHIQFAIFLPLCWEYLSHDLVKVQMNHRLKNRMQSKIKLLD